MGSVDAYLLTYLLSELRRASPYLQINFCVRNLKGSPAIHANVKTFLSSLVALGRFWHHCIADARVVGRSRPKRISEG